MSLVLFPSEPFSPTATEPDFELEQSAARQAGLETALIDHTRVTQNEVAGAVARVPASQAVAMYRGWMLTPRQYTAMYGALQNRGVLLLNGPEAYRTCHYLPDSYPLIEGHTPRSVWIPVDGAVNFDRVSEAIATFGDHPLVLKDYVKSQKHLWTEACFIPSATDRSAVERVVNRFVELQGDDLNGGLVFREYVPLKIVGHHPKSGLPLAAEFRIFWLDGEPILTHRYWGDLTSFEAPVPLEELRPVAARIPSRCFTMDVAMLEGGGWTIVELGDGQVAGLPSPELAPEFYRRLKTTLS